MNRPYYEAAPLGTYRLYPNFWDFIVFIPILLLFALFAYAAKDMKAPYAVGDVLRITLDPKVLPYYAMRTIIRLFAALGISLIFSIIFGYWAAHSPRAERIIIPLVDILQSVPVLGFLSMTIVMFIHLFPNSLLGPECAAIFAIFTSQAWNMLLSLYGSCKTLPESLRETTRLLRLSAWQRFWRLEMPYAMPGLLWNTMISLSGGWFFVVASEAISVSNQSIFLPGMGSYIAVAIEQANAAAIGYAIGVLLIVILLYDQLLFRPLLAWSQKFCADPSEDMLRASWVLSLLRRTRLISRVHLIWSRFSDAWVNHRWFLKQPALPNVARNSSISFRKLAIEWLVGVGMLALIVILSFLVLQFILKNIGFQEILTVFGLGGVTALRIFVLVAIVSLVWVPVGVWIGLRPGATQWVQPIAQFLAAFPANVLFPIVVMGIVKFNLNPEIWTSPLMILGTQWLILFNVIAGAAMIPKDLRYATQNLGVRGWLWWRKLALPAIFPYYITGVFTAVGGAWNASIVAEWVSWGPTHLQVTGLGAYIAQYTQAGDFPRIVLGIAVMCIEVTFLNHVLWQRLYAFAEKHYTLSART